MGEINKTDELQHWGIKGMRWGIRRSKKQLAKESGKKNAELESDTFKTSKKKSVSKLTDEELQKEVNRRKLENDLQRQKNDALDIENRRLELEKKYAELNPAKVSLGKRMYDEIWPRAKKATLDAGETLLRDGLVTKGKQLLGIDGKDPIDAEVKSTDAAAKKIDHEIVSRMHKTYKQREQLQTKLKNTKDASERSRIQSEIDELTQRYNDDNDHLRAIRPKKK